jgi:hypothetical protein
MRRTRLAVSLAILAVSAPRLRAADKPQPSSSACLEAFEERLGLERAELERILAKHTSGAGVDGRIYGLPQHEFDDASTMTVRQRQMFRKLAGNLGYPTSGPLQYPRWAYSYVNRLDTEGKVRCGGDGGVGKSDGASQYSALVVGPNVDASNDSISEAETYIAIDPTNAQVLVGASNINLNGRGQMMYYSANGGSSWNHVELVPTRLNHSDPHVGFDSNGTVWSATLDYSSNKTQVKFYKSTDHGATWPSQVIVDDNPGNDKELATVDYQVASGCRDQVYIGWDDGKAQYVSSTTSPGSGVFRPKTIVQSKGSTIAADLAVGPPSKAGASAPVYSVWTSTTQKAINLSRSTDCGATWSAYVTVATTADSYDYGIPAQCNRRVLIYPSIDVDRSTSARSGWVYVVWNDFTSAQGSGCIAATDPNTANVWFSRSSDGGKTWSAKSKVNSTIPNTDHFNQWMHVDDGDGTIHVSWRDTRNDVNRQKTDVYYTKSTDGGATWQPEIRVTTASSDETTAGASADQYGDYEGLSVRNGCAPPLWTDRRGSGAEEIYTTEICP